jgi:hypothetical protein
MTIREIKDIDFKMNPERAGWYISMLCHYEQENELSENLDDIIQAVYYAGANDMKDAIIQKIRISREYGDD